ncbi:hypothetical protein VTO42DRAFT_2692 [Malbranchea cinnamomea]
MASTFVQKSPSRPLPPFTSRPGFHDASQLRRRQGHPSGTAADAPPATPYIRRTSTFSDMLTDTGQSLKTSAGSILMPHMDPRWATASPDSDSLLQSLPLVLALLPAFGGLFFRDAHAYLTDLTLLILAVIFLNWCTRIPWSWYCTARCVTYPEDSVVQRISEPANFETTHPDAASASSSAAEDRHKRGISSEKPSLPPSVLAARRELSRHELAALVSCLLGPVVGVWLLHVVRLQLSQPAGGLLTNYNLCIFFLAAEMRPAAHILRLLHARTLHLQEIVQSKPYPLRDTHITKITELEKRLGEIEAHIALHGYAQDTQAESPSRKRKEREREQFPSDIVRVVQQLIQPNLEASHRSRLENERLWKSWSTNTEERMRNLEMRVQEAFSVAAYTRQRNASSSSFRPVQWIWSVVSLPLRFMLILASLPIRTAAWCFRGRRATVQAS